MCIRATNTWRAIWLSRWIASPAMPRRRRRWPTARAHDPASARVTTLGEEKRVNAFLRLQNPGDRRAAAREVPGDRRRAGRARGVRETARAAQQLVVSCARARVLDDGFELRVEGHGLDRAHVRAAGVAGRHQADEGLGGGAGQADTPGRRTRARRDAAMPSATCASARARVRAWMPGPSTCARSRCANSLCRIRRARHAARHPRRGGCCRRNCSCIGSSG